MIGLCESNGFNEHDHIVHKLTADAFPANKAIAIMAATAAFITIRGRQSRLVIKYGCGCLASTEALLFLFEEFD